MDSSITFLGSGGGRQVMTSQLRGTGGIILNLQKTQIHLDPGPGSAVFAKLYNIDLSKTSVILTSHHHIDNCNDLNLAIDSITLGGKIQKGTLIITNEVLDKVLTKHHENLVEKLIIINKLNQDNQVSEIIKEINLPGIKIVPTKTKDHCGGFGFKFITANYVIGYTSDTAYFASLPGQFKDCNILIINNMYSFNIKEPSKNHLSSLDSLNLIQKLKSYAKLKLVILTHFGTEIIASDPIYDARKLTKETGVQVIAAADGMSIDPVNYAVTNSQKSLGDY
ncbi:hypothetical protein HN587_05705 [Candidatus Woesearchaeota archaeon]|jgi:ribonuclease BN (tRNA processing enzyme)|nr:hypothetical protein [Candidatus Woesearchaeota archaeon]